MSAVFQLQSPPVVLGAFTGVVSAAGVAWLWGRYGHRYGQFLTYLLVLRPLGWLVFASVLGRARQRVRAYASSSNERTLKTAHTPLAAFIK